MRTRHDEYDDALVALAGYAKAMGHPARLAILQTLAARTTCSCGDVVDHLPLAQATVSQHLKALRDAGLVQGEIEGPRVCYCLDLSGMARLAASLDAFLKTIVPACCAFTHAGPQSEIPS